MLLTSPLRNIRVPRVPKSTIFASLFWISVAVSLYVHLVRPLARPLPSLDLNRECQPAPAGSDVCSATLTKLFPQDCIVLEDNRELIRCDTQEEIERQRTGYYSLAHRPRIVWASSDGTDPSSNGRNYRLLGRLAFSISKTLLIPWLSLTFGLLAWWTARAEKRSQLNVRQVPNPLLDASGLSERSPVWLRLVLIGVVGVALGLALHQGWDRTVVTSDSKTYVLHAPIRAPLYPWFIELFQSRQGGVEGKQVVPLATWDPAFRFLPVVRAQKALFVLAVVVLLWVLSGSLNCWGLAMLAGLAVFGEYQASWPVLLNLDCLMTEGLNAALILLYLAATWAYLRCPGLAHRMGIAAILVLMLLNRPANLPFLAVVPVLWLYHWRRNERTWAGRTAIQLGGAVAGCLALNCLFNYFTAGYFQPHALTGGQAIGVTLDLASPADIGKMGDPELDQVLKICLADPRRHEHPLWKDGLVDVDQNLYQVAFPAYQQVFQRSDAWHMNAVFLRMSRRLVVEHTGRFLQIAFAQFRLRFWEWPLHGIALFSAFAAAFLYWRTRAWPYLFVSLVASLPFLNAVPVCVLCYPCARYRSQLYFAEVLSLPLLGVILWQLGPQVAKLRASQEKP